MLRKWIVDNQEPDEDADEDDAGDAQVDNWELVYLALTMLSKIFLIFPQQLQLATSANVAGGKPPSKKKRVSERDAEKLDRGALEENQALWSAVQKHLLYSHSWVRLASSRLVGSYMGAREPATLLGKQGSEFLADQETIFQLGKAFCRQLASTQLTSALADQLVRNLFFTARVLSVVDSAAIPAPVDAGEPAEEVKPSGLKWKMMQLSYLARTEATTSPETSLVRDCVFKVFAAFSNFLKDPEPLQPWLRIMLEPLYRTDESQDSSEEIKLLSTQVSDLLRQIAGPAAFSKQYEGARVKVVAARNSRKQVRIQQNVLEPAKAAERKAKKNLLKRDSRKRKITQLREDQGRHFKQPKP